MISSQRSNLKIVITNTNDSESESPTTLKTGPFSTSPETYSTGELFQMIKNRLKECETQNLFKHSQNSQNCPHCILFQQLKTFLNDIDRKSQNFSDGFQDQGQFLSEEQLNEIKQVYTRLEKAFFENDEPKKDERVCSCGMTCNLF